MGHICVSVQSGFPSGGHSMVSSADVMWVPSPALGLGVGVPRVGLRPRSSGGPSPPRDPHPLSCRTGPALLDSPLLPSMWLLSVLVGRLLCGSSAGRSFQLRLWRSERASRLRCPHPGPQRLLPSFLRRRLGGLRVLAAVGAGSTGTLQDSDFIPFSCESAAGLLVIGQLYV